MSSNTTEFDTRFFTQIDGATVGSPDSGSIMDIFGTIHTNKKIQENSGKFRKIVQLNQKAIADIEMTLLMFVKNLQEKTKN